MFGHMTELLGLLVVGLLIFGPKRMIELGGQLGRMWRETQSALKEMNWNPLGDDSKNASGSPQSALSKFSQFAQDLGAQRSAADAPAAENARVVEMAPPSNGDSPAD